MSKNNKKPNLVVAKPPGEGAPFPMHQDYHYFPYEKDSMVAIFIHLDDTDVENGGLAVFPGSHKTGPLQDKSKSNLF
jgi:phytanoyl-CoA hydroxylase